MGDRGYYVKWVDTSNPALVLHGIVYHKDQHQAFQKVNKCLVEWREPETWKPIFNEKKKVKKTLVLAGRLIVTGYIN